jgi:hypothetical protein
MNNDHLTTARFIDQQASKHLVYRYDGAQAHVRASRDNSVLLIIDLSDFDNVTVTTVIDASDYFLAYANYPSHYKSLLEAYPLEAHYSMFGSRPVITVGN